MIFKDPSDLQAAVNAYRAKTCTTQQHIRAALCDMDGTLYDSMSRHAKAWYRMITEQGIACDENEFLMYEGMTGAATIRLLFQRAFGTVPDEARIKELYHLKTLYFSEQPKPDPMPGAQHLVQYFRRMGIRPVLVTGSGQTTLLNRLDTDYNNAFAADLRVTAHNVTKGKPNPEPYLKGLEMAQVCASDAIVLENAPLGVESGARAGIFTIAVATGPVPLQALNDAGASIVFSSMPQCDKYFPELLFCLNT
ncbi:MAG: HAD family hydrolase [Muribaculaceae bacterium]